MEEHKNIVVKYGPDEYRLSLPQSTAAAHTVRDLAELVEKSCCVPVAQQRLIFRGQSLKNLDATLNSYGITNNSKVMLIMGAKPSKSPRETEALEKLHSVEVKAESLYVDLCKIKEKIENTQKGLVSDKPEAIKRELLGNADNYMRLLESMDALDLNNANTAMQDARAKRKTLVDRIQGHLDQNDHLKAQLDQLTRR